MIVQVTNITDGPGKSPAQVDIYNKTLDPGVTLRLPAELINEKVRKLEEAGLIAIGQLPSWYTAAKSRKGRSLTAEEMQKRINKQAPIPQPVLEPAPELVSYEELPEPISSLPSAPSTPQPPIIEIGAVEPSVEIFVSSISDSNSSGERRRKR